MLTPQMSVRSEEAKPLLAPATALSMRQWGYCGVIIFVNMYASTNTIQL